MTRMTLPRPSSIRILALAIGAAGLALAQPKLRHPMPPFPYDSIDITYENKVGGVKLAGTLTMPKAGGPFPAVLLINGSSSNVYNRDDGDRKSYLVLSDYLTRQGIAVLRVDDRGAGQSTGNKLQSTVLALAGDAVAGVKFLKQRKEIDPKRIGVLGHSFGGMTAALAASRSADIAFVVTLAGAHAVRRVRTGPPPAGRADWENRFDAAVQESWIQAAATNMSEEELARRIEEQFLGVLNGLGEAERKAAIERIPDVAARARQAAAQGSLPLIRSDVSLDPGLGPKNTKVPFLALYGSIDPTNSPITNVPALISFLIDAGNPDYAVTVVPGLNHGLWTCVQPVAAGVVCAEEEYSPKVLQLVGDWILRH